MQVIGTVKEIWRYPVKSMAGERMKRASVGALGIYGDRGWAIRDEKAGEIRNARKLPALLHCTAVYLREPSGSDVPPAQITMPNGTTFRSDSAEANAQALRNARAARLDLADPAAIRARIPSPRRARQSRHDGRDARGLRPAGK